MAKYKIEMYTGDPIYVNGFLSVSDGGLIFYETGDPVDLRIIDVFGPGTYSRCTIVNDDESTESETDK